MLSNIVLLEPEPEETLHSVLITGWRLSAFYTFPFFTKSIFKHTTDGRGWSWNYKRICPYFDPCRATGSALLSRTLLIPYLVPFMPPQAANAAFRRLDGDRRIPAQDSETVWRPYLNHALRYCPRCVQIQMTRVHRSFWLRPHQLDHVEVCWRHGVRLVSVMPFNGRSLFPHEYADQNIRPCRDYSDLWLARQSYELLHGNHPATDSKLRRKVYQDQSLRIGYTKGRRTDFHLMAVHLLRKFGHGFFQKIMLATDINHIARSLRSTIYGEDQTIRPINQILCMDVLFGEQSLFFNRVRSAKGSSESASKVKIFGQHNSQFSVHRAIFLECLKLNGPDVMNILAKRYPLTHTWILQHALSWSRRRIAEQIQGPDRERILRQRASDLRTRTNREQDELRRRIAERASLTKMAEFSNDPISPDQMSQSDFENVASSLGNSHHFSDQFNWSGFRRSYAVAPTSQAYETQEQWQLVGRSF